MISGNCRALFCRCLSGIALILLLAGISYGADSNQTFRITYVSTEYVYIDGGAADGLTPGTHLIVGQKGVEIAQLEVAFASERSAACRVTKSTASLSTGMIASIPTAPGTGVVPAVVPAADTTKVSSKMPEAPRLASKVKSSINGSVSAIFDQTVNNGPFGSSLTQSTARLNLRGRNVGAEGLNFSLQLRARRDHRSRAFLNNVATDAWVNRLYEAYVSYEAKNAPVNFSFGRIPIRRVGTAGFVDGVLVENRMSGSVRTGLYGGAQSRWQYADQTTSLQKYGGYLNIKRGGYATGLFEMTLALAGEYHAATTSRELIYTDGRWDYSDRLNLNLQSEVDINRGWRKNRVGKSLSLSSLYFDSRLKLSKFSAIGLNYDDRKNYWTYDLRTLSDSLFDSRARQGLRARLDARFPKGYFTSVTVGQRRTSGDANKSNSYSINLNKSGFIMSGSDISLQYFGFSGSGQSGDNVSARIGTYFIHRDYVGIGYGIYKYRWSPAASTRTNGWLELTTRLQFLKNFFIYGLYQSSSGDDTKGHRVQIELGHTL